MHCNQLILKVSVNNEKLLIHLSIVAVLANNDAIAVKHPKTDPL